MWPPADMYAPAKIRKIIMVAHKGVVAISVTWFIDSHFFSGAVTVLIVRHFHLFFATDAHKLLTLSIPKFLEAEDPRASESQTHDTAFSAVSRGIKTDTDMSSPPKHCPPNQEGSSAGSGVRTDRGIRYLIREKSLLTEGESRARQQDIQSLES